MAGQSKLVRWRRWRTDTMTRVHARMAARAKPASGFVSQPEPRSIGSMARGRQLVSGNFLFAGYLVEGGNADLWALPIPAARFETELHSFIWLDDLAAVGNFAARKRAQAWAWGWIDRYGRGQGPGWVPELTGRRLIRWINHAVFLLRAQDKAASGSYFAMLGRQTTFLARRWRQTAPGLPRFEALCGLVYAGLSLEGMEHHTAPALKALERECDALIDREGGLPTRNPEELLEVFTLLTWVAQALDAVDRAPATAHANAIGRIAPTLRALRHSDGGLARFHGGGRGLEGRLDEALAMCPIRTGKVEGLAMGFSRLASGRTSIVLDASSPPIGDASINAHASTLAFELTSGRRPVIVNCGSGAQFGETWRRAGRATPSHSTLGIDGTSSSRFAPLAAGALPGQEAFSDGPYDVRLQSSSTLDGTSVMVGHDGYVPTHGLTHVRKLMLSRDGRTLTGEDTLGALTEADRSRFERAMTRSRLQGAAFSIRFHMHPDVDAELDLNGGAVSLALKSGEIWVFQHDGTATLTLEPSVYLESGRLKPRAARQIVLSAKVVEFARQINWTLAKAQDTPSVVRDFAGEHEDDLDPALTF